MINPATTTTARLLTAPNGPRAKTAGALQFDGKDDYVDCGNDESLNITEAITIEAWVRHDEGGVYDGILQRVIH